MSSRKCFMNRYGTFLDLSTKTIIVYIRISTILCHYFHQRLYYAFIVFILIDIVSSFHSGAFVVMFQIMTVALHIGLFPKKSLVIAIKIHEDNESNKFSLIFLGVIEKSNYQHKFVYSHELMKFGIGTYRFNSSHLFFVL